MWFLARLLPGLLIQLVVLVCFSQCLVALPLGPQLSPNLERPLRTLRKAGLNVSCDIRESGAVPVYIRSDGTKALRLIPRKLAKTLSPRKKERLYDAGRRLCKSIVSLSPSEVSNCDASDINADGIIDASDLMILLGTFGAPSVNNPADIDGNGMVELSDLLMLLGCFGSLVTDGGLTPKSVTPTASPSPTPRVNTDEGPTATPTPISTPTATPTFTKTPVPTSTPSSPGCLTTSATFQNQPFAIQTGIFEVSFELIPSASTLDVVVGLSSGAATSYSALAAILRLNSTGTFDVRNGASYGSDAVLQYSAGTSYQVRMAVDILSHTYSVYVTPAGGIEITLASSYDFRSEQSAVASFANLSMVSSSGNAQICDFAFVPPSIPSSPIGFSASALSGSEIQLTWTDTSSNETSFVLQRSVGNTQNFQPLITLSANATSHRDSGLTPATTYHYRLVAANSAGTSNFASSSATTSQQVANPLTPIARWDVVPHQRIDAGSSLNLGVVAFSKAGISHVTFRPIGQGYAQGSKVATQMTRNPHTGVWEYWVTLSASEFSSDGAISVEAVVYGKDGGVIDKTTYGGGQGMDALSLEVNPNGSLPKLEAWVQAGYSGASALGDPNRPFPTIESATYAIQALGGCAGSFIYLKPGIHSAASTNNNQYDQSKWIRCSSGWMTITTASGATLDNTIVTGSGAIFNIERVRVKGITLQRTGGTIIQQCNAGDSRCTLRTKVWIDQSKYIGNQLWYEMSDLNLARYVHTGPLSPGVSVAYFTDVDITNVNFAVPQEIVALARGLNIHDISQDAFQNIPLIINVTADGLDGCDSPHVHADFIGDSRHTGHNRIVYGARGVNLRYQGMWTNSNSCGNPLQGQAFVNVFLSTAPLPSRAECVIGVSDGGQGSGWYLNVNHLLFWHTSFVSKTSQPFTHDVLIRTDGCTTTMSNTSFVGNFFDSMSVAGNAHTLITDTTSSSWNHNHFANGSSYGGNITQGAANFDSYGKPTSPNLKNRVFPLVVPVDADGNARNPSGASIGAYD